MKRTIASLAALGFALGLAGPAAAEDLGGGFSVTGGATIVSDYRFRGVSLSDEDFAVQGTFNINHSSGFYVGTWATSTEDSLLYGNAEIDLYAGYTREIASGTTIDVGLLYYWYPNGGNAVGPGGAIVDADASFFEPYASIAHTLGPVTAKVGVAFAPEQEDALAESNTYVFGSLSGGIPGTGLTLSAQLGYSEGALDFGTGGYLDWRIGANYAVGPLNLGLAYVDSDLPDGHTFGSAVVFSIGVAFQ